MAHEQDWSALAARLRDATGIELVQFEPGEPISDDDREMAKLLEGAELPPPVLALLERCNGLKLLWNGKVAGRDLQGSINILPFLPAALRAGATEDSKPLENVLWNEEMTGKAKAELQKMVVFEALAGRSAYLAYRLGDKKAKLCLVENDRIDPLVPDFKTVVAQLVRFAGADGVREHLTHKDWRDRLEGDAVLQEVAAL
jgi:hypothetical protein